MISVHEGQIKEILRPETSDELQLIARASQKWSISFPLLHDVTNTLDFRLSFMQLWTETSQLQTFSDLWEFDEFT